MASENEFYRHKWAVKEDVVISGMSGRFSKSESVASFQDNLMNGVSMMTGGNDRFPSGLHDFPLLSGKVTNLNKFDAEFFNIPSEQAHDMYPQMRKLLEVSFEAIIDSGFDVDSLRGSKTGFFYGSSLHDTDMTPIHDRTSIPSYKQKLTTLIPNFYGFNGPIGQYDTACASSYSALEEAFIAIKSGQCDRALVAGANICLFPMVTSFFRDLQMCSKSGLSKCLDASADGYARGEAVCCIMLQKSGEAKRVYSTLVNCRGNTDGFKDQGITFPSSDLQNQLMRETFSEVDLDPKQISYIEAHATGTTIGDVIELKAIEDIFCADEDRKSNPLSIGCLKSNMGHAEAASGLCATIKANLIFQTGLIPGNLHFKTPNPRIEGLMNKKMKPVIQVTPFQGKYIPINCFGFGGSNVHVILKCNELRSSRDSFAIATEQVPRLVNICGRHEESVQYIQNFLEQSKSQLTREFFDLLNQYSKTKNMPSRGYTLIYLHENEYHFKHHIGNPKFEAKKDFYLNFPKNVCNIDPSFQNIPIFHETFKRLHDYSEKLKINLNAKIIGQSKADNLIESTVSSISIQIAFINLFKKIGIELTGIISGSFSQLINGYLNNTLTEQETISIAFCLNCARQFNENNGQKLNNQFNLQDILSILDSMNNLNGNTNNLKNLLLRESQRVNEIAIQLFISEQITQNNDKSTISIEMASQLNNNNESKIIFEIPSDKVHSGLIKVESFLECLGNLYSEGGLTLDLSPLYPEVKYPVPIDTLGLHSLIKWNHSQDWRVFRYFEYFNSLNGLTTRKFKVNISETNGYLADHKIDGRILFPATGLIMLAWQTVAAYHNRPVTRFPLEMKDLKLSRATVLSDVDIKFTVKYFPDSGMIEIIENGITIATGKVIPFPKIEHITEPFTENFSALSKISKENLNTLNESDIYKELKIRGYDYGPYFRCLSSTNFDFTKGTVNWKEPPTEQLSSTTKSAKIQESAFCKTWITFADSALQLDILSAHKNRKLFVPVAIETLICDPSIMINHINEFNRNQEQYKQEEEKKETESSTELKKEVYPEFSVLHNPSAQTIVTNGFLAKGLKAVETARKNQTPNLETYEFVPFEEDSAIDEISLSRLENYQNLLLRLSEFLKSSTGQKIPQDILDEIDLNSENYSFAKLLVDFSNKIDTTPKEIFKLLSGDILFDSDNVLCSQKRFLQPFLNMVIPREVYADDVYAALHITEVNEGKHFLYNSVQSMVADESTGLIRLKYNIFRHESSSNSDVIENLTSGTNLVTWKSLDDGSPFSHELSENNLIIVKINDETIDYLQKLITRLSLSIKAQGKILIIARDEYYRSPIEDALKIMNRKYDEIFPPHLNAETVIKYMTSQGWTLISRRCLHKSMLPLYGLLFTKNIDLKSSENDNIIIVDPLEYSWVDDLKLAISTHEDSRIWLASANNKDQGVLGLVKCISLELGGHRVRCIANRPGSSSLDLSKIDFTKKPFNELLIRDSKYNIYDDQLGWGDYCHFDIPDKIEQDLNCFLSADKAYLQCLVPGDLSSLVWTEFSDNVDLSKNEYMVNVHYSSLNFKDIMHATGRLPPDLLPNWRKSSKKTVPIGIEFSGKDMNGNNLMGMVPCGALSSHVKVTSNDFIWQVPPDWSLEDAATVPVVYATVVYGLLIRGNLKKGETVLIHAGAGGVGMAALNIALNLGCHVYTTVGSQEKRDYLKKLFPSLNENNFANSRDTSFEDHIMHQTEGRGVDVILNSLSEDKLQASLRCLAPGGRFLEIGKYDIIQNNPINMGRLDQDRSFHGVMLDAFFDNSAKDKESELAMEREKMKINQFMLEGLKNGIIKPLPRKIFSRSQVEQAFRFMASGRHIGKVVVKITDDTSISRPISALRSVLFNPEKVYVIIGGFGGFGFELAQWMVQKGARHIILNSRNGPKSNYHKFCLDRMKKFGANLILSTHDLTMPLACQDMISSVSPRFIGGFFNCALVLNDALITDQTQQTFEKVCSSKVRVTYNLDKISRSLCPDLEYFVLFSSLVSSRGNPGQTNYGLANSYMESVCERRRKEGLHGFAIQWGFVGDVGVIVEKISSEIESIQGTAPQRLHSCFAVLERLLNYPAPVISSFVRAESQKKLTSYSGDIVTSISHILGIKDIHSVDPKSTLSELGLDSLMAVEVQHALERQFKVTMNTKEIRSLSVGQLFELSKQIKSGQINTSSETSKAN